MVELKNKYRDAIIQHATEYYKQLVEILTPEKWDVPVKSLDKVMPLGKFLLMNRPRTEYQPELHPFVPSIVAQDALFILSSLDLRCKVLREQLDNTFKMIILALEEMEGALKNLEEERTFREEYVEQQEAKIEQLRDLIYNFAQRQTDSIIETDVGVLGEEDSSPPVPKKPTPEPKKKKASRKGKGIPMDEIDFTVGDTDDIELPEPKD